MIHWRSSWAMYLQGAHNDYNWLIALPKCAPYGRCILLLEDLDAAFTRGISRDENSTGAPTKATAPTAKEKKDEEDNASTLTLSGLLNSLDGVAAAEGR